MATGVVDAYIDELGRSLHGPKRVKADLLREARDSLVDATLAHQAAGHDRAAAERRAIAEFGEAGEIAAGYRTELGAAQGRRTAWLVLAIIGMQPLLWQSWWPWFAAVEVQEPGPVYLAVQAAAEWLGMVGALASLLAVPALGIGSRFVRGERRLIRAVGLGAMVVCGGLAASALALASLSADQPFAAWLPWMLPLLFLPLAIVALAGRRCFVAVSSPISGPPRPASS